MTENQIEEALGRLDRSLRLYLWLQGRVRSCDVSADKHFQKKFVGFYRVRRGSQWLSAYFGLMESAKARGIEFAEALTEISRATGRVEASFASKLVATLDPSKPVIDKFVLKNFALRLPRRGLPDREHKMVELYGNLCEKYLELIQSSTGITIREQFDRRYPGFGLTELKKVDLVLWQIRG